jgi:LAO/AO transport system kinase
VTIARTAHTTVVVEAPGLGDDIQAIKAGLMEIADVFVVNKADRQGADQAAHALQMMLELGGASGRQEGQADQPAWEPPICMTVATDGTGVREVLSAIDAHRAYLLESGRMAHSELERARSSLEALLHHELFSRFLSQLQPGELERVAARIASRHISPYEGLEQLLESASPQRN